MSLTALNTARTFVESVACQEQKRKSAHAARATKGAYAGDMYVDGFVGLFVKPLEQALNVRHACVVAAILLGRVVGKEVREQRRPALLVENVALVQKSDQL